jgi:hypothetical protein
MALPASSGAQDLPSDPEADSPSGVVYEIPVEKGRRDAAPREQVAPDDGGRARDESETSIRSDNNFGTSSEVPGVGEGADGDSGESGGTGGGSGGDGSGGSDSGSGSVESAARDAAGSTAASADGPSEGVVYPLLAVLIAVGAAIGLFAGHRAHRGGHA